MRRLAILGFLIGLWPAVTAASTFRIPDEKPVANISIPDGWDSRTTDDGGIEATSPDGLINLSAGVIESGGALGEGLKFPARDGLQIDPASGSAIEIKVNDRDGYDLSFTGKDKDGPCKISVKLVSTYRARRVLALYVWGPNEAHIANAQDLKAIVDSIKALK